MPLTPQLIGDGTHGNYPHQRFGPYSYGSAEYVMALDSAGTGTVCVYKSTDAWATNARQDQAGEPSNAYWSFTYSMNQSQLGVFRVGNKLYALLGRRLVTFPTPKYFEMLVWAFDLTTDEWAADPILSGVSDMASPGNPDYRPLACPVVRSTDEVVIYFNGTVEMVGGEECDRLYYRRLDVSVPSWSAATLIMGSGIQMSYYAISAREASDDAIHMIWCNRNAAGPAVSSRFISHIRLNASNVLGSITDICASDFQAANSNVDARAVSMLDIWTEGGIEKIGLCRLAYMGGTAYDLYTLLGSPASAPSWTEDLAVASTGVNWQSINVEQIVAFAYFNGSRYAFWVDYDAGTPSDTWVRFTQNAGSGWSAAADYTTKIHSLTGNETLQRMSAQRIGSNILGLTMCSVQQSPYDEFIYITRQPAAKNFGVFGNPTGIGGSGGNRGLSL